MIGLVVAGALAAGVVVDATAAAETRATEAGPTSATDTGGGGLFGALVLRPGLSGAVERGGFALAASYSPQLSMVTTSLAPAILNAGDLRAEVPFGPRFRLRVNAGGSIGDLDPGTAQGVLSSSAGLLAPVAALSFASANAGVGAAARLTRTVSLDVDARGAVTGSPDGSALIAPSTSGGLDATLAWQAWRTDAFTVGGEARSLAVDGRGSVVGGAPTVGWRHQLGPSSGVDARAGLGAVALTTGGADDGVYALPAFAVAAHALLDVAGSPKLEVNGGAGLDLSNDPLGALLDDRLSASLGLGFRATREISFHVDSAGFWSVFSVNPPRKVNGVDIENPVSTALVANRGSISWEFTDGASLELSALSTTRLVGSFLATDATVGLSVNGTIPVFHAGDRPEGSDPRAGRDIGVERVAAPPPPGSTTIEAPPPLPEVPEEPPVPPALAAPPPNIPILEAPLNLPSLHEGNDKLRDASKAADDKRDKKKRDKKKHAGDKALGLDDTAPAPVAPKDPQPAATP